MFNYFFVFQRFSIKTNLEFKNVLNNYNIRAVLWGGGGKGANALGCRKRLKFKGAL